MLDETEFLSDFGIRSLSKVHAEHPYVFDYAGREYRVAYDPGESDFRIVRRQLELARADLDAGQLSARRVDLRTFIAITATISRSNARRVPVGS